MDMQPPPAMQQWLGSLPQKYVGTFYAKVRPPLMPFGFWFRVPAWGQLCDGGDNAGFVHDMLYNEFPFHGRGWTYVEWKCESSNSNNDAPLKGKVLTPITFDGQP